MWKQREQRELSNGTAQGWPGEAGKIWLLSWSPRPLKRNKQTNKNVNIYTKINGYLHAKTSSVGERGLSKLRPLADTCVLQIAILRGVDGK